jgi:hypothetical protein
VLLHQLVHAARVFERRVDLGIAVVAHLVVPAALVGVLVLSVVPAGIQAVVKGEILAHDERHVRVIADVVVLDFVVGEQVVDDTAQENDVRTGTGRDVIVRHRSGSGKARIDHDQLGAAMRLRFRDPFKPARGASAALPPMTRMTSAFLMFDPVIRHRTTSKCRGKTCHRWTVSNTCLIVEWSMPVARIVLWVK